MSRAIAVIGQGAPDGGPAADAARSVGRLLAQAGATVVTGGLGGVMAAAGSGARAAGGRVTAILPGTDRRAAREADTVVCSGVGEARDLAVVASADAVIAVGGGWGTLARRPAPPRPAPRPPCGWRSRRRDNRPPAHPDPRLRRRPPRLGAADGSAWGRRGGRPARAPPR